MIDIKIQSGDETIISAECKMVGSGKECFRELTAINYTILNKLLPGMTEDLVRKAAEAVKQALIMEFKYATSVEIDRKKG